MKKKKTPTSWTRRVLIALIVLLSIVLATLIGVAIFLNSMLGKVNIVDPNQESTMSPEEASSWMQDQTEDDDSVVSLPVLNPDEIDWGDEASDIVGLDEDVINILLIGQDRRPGEGRTRSDAMLLCSFNTKTNTITITSFLRDTYVKIPNGYLANRLNVPYVLGGMSLLDQTLETNFGVHVDANVEVDFDGFIDLIDLLGGVDITLTDAEARYLNNIGNYSLSSGANHLDGEKALAYSRIRKIDSDLARTNRQRTVIMALLESAKKMKISQALDLVDKAFSLVATDVEYEEICSYVVKLLPMLSSCTINTQQIPADGTYSFSSIDDGNGNKMSVIIADMDANRQILRDILG